MFLICPLKYNYNLMVLFLKRLKQNQYLKQHPMKIFQIFLNKLFQKWKSFFIDNDKFDEYKKPETRSIKQPSIDDSKDFVIIPDNEKAEISKSLFQTDIQIEDNFKWKKTNNRKPYRKLVKKKQDAFDVALADTQTFNYNDDLSLDDLETADSSNDTSVTDLVPVPELKTIKEDENDDIEVMKMVQKVVISNDGDDDGDDEFLKQMPLHPRGKLKCSEKKYLQILPKIKELIQRSKNQRKEIEFVKKVTLHPREHLKRKNRLKDEPELKYLETVPCQPRDSLSRRLKNASKNIVCDEESLKEFPYFNEKESK